MKIYKEVTSWNDFDFWSGAKDTVKYQNISSTTAKSMRRVNDMAKTTKIMDINMMNGNGKFICIYDSTAQFNPFKLYLKWYSPGTGWHKKKLAD